MDLNCYLCASPCTRLFRKVRNHTLLICSECGLVYRQTRLNGAGISVDQRKFLDEYLREEGLYARYFNDKLRVIERCRPTGSLLDFGCGAGTFLRCARERGWEVVGVEGSVPAATHSRSTGLDVREGVIEDLKLSGRFDVVTAFQTIEHFADPLAFLSNIRNLLKPGGLLVLTTPDRRSLLGKLMGKRWFGYFNDEHLFFYDCGSFQKSIEKAGFSDVVVVNGAEICRCRVGMPLSEAQKEKFSQEYMGHYNFTERISRCPRQEYAWYLRPFSFKHPVTGKDVNTSVEAHNKKYLVQCPRWRKLDGKKIAR